MKSLKTIVLFATLFSTMVFASSKDYVVQGSSIESIHSAQVVSGGNDLVSINVSVTTVVPHCQGTVLNQFAEVNKSEVKLLEVVKLHPAPEPIIIEGPNGEEIRRVMRVCTTVLITKTQLLNFKVEFDSALNEMIVDIKGNYGESQIKLTRGYFPSQGVVAELL